MTLANLAKDVLDSRAKALSIDAKAELSSVQDCGSALWR